MIYLTWFIVLLAATFLALESYGLRTTAWLYTGSSVIYIICYNFDLVTQ